MSLVSVPVLVLAVTDNLEALFIVFIRLNSSSPSINQAKFPCEKNKNSFFPDFAITEDFFYMWPLVTLSSFLIFSFFLKVTKSLDGSLFKFFGALSKGIVCAKQIFPLLPLYVKASQLLYLPILFG